MRILHVTSEMAPVAKTGGLGDVTHALTDALAARGHEVRTVLPRYGHIHAAEAGFERLPVALEVPMGSHSRHGGLWWARRDSGAEVFLLEHDGLYERAGIYGDRNGDFGDNDLRFSFLCRGALAIAHKLRWWPDVVHGHDWQGALAVWMAGRETRRLFRSVFTIHNMGYQGVFGRESVPRMGMDTSAWEPGGAEMYGGLNLMKAGIVAADQITTVSPRYALEIQSGEQGFGLDGLLRSRSSSVRGILNGVDYAAWDPRHDGYLTATYGPADLSGKRANKAALLREMGLDDADLDSPVVGVVSRLAWQKGIDLLVESTPVWMPRSGARLVVLGAGSERIAGSIASLASYYPGRIGARFEVNERLAHLVEAGSDIFAMPSRYEPCGLNQMYSMRYGTVPVVRATGGLDDTVEEVDFIRGTGTGFKFRAVHPDALGGAMRRALAAFGHEEAWRALMLRGMSQDFSWDRAAAAYEDVYRNVGGTDVLTLPSTATPTPR